MFRGMRSCDVPLEIASRSRAVTLDLTCCCLSFMLDRGRGGGAGVGGGCVGAGVGGAGTGGGVCTLGELCCPPKHISFLHVLFDPFDHTSLSCFVHDSFYGVGWCWVDGWKDCVKLSKHGVVSHACEFKHIEGG